MEDQELDDLVWSCLNKTRPTRLQDMIARLERKTGRIVCGFAFINESRKRLVAAGRAKLVKQQGVTLGAVRLLPRQSMPRHHQ